MRKVLLTTTALVAFGGVSAASAIDISGSYMFDYTINDNGTANTGGNNNTAMGSDARIAFSGSSTTDAGLTFGGAYAINHGAAVEDMGIYVSGDFGYIMAGATDSVVDGMDAFMMGSDYPEIGAGTTNSTVNGGAGVLSNDTAEKVGFRSNVISGFQVGISHEDAGRTSKADVNSWAVTYDFGVAKVGYSSSSTGSAAGTSSGTDMKAYGIATNVGDFNIRFSNGTDTTKGTTGSESSKIDTSDYGFSYGGIENVSLYYNGVKSEEKTGTNAGDEMSATIVGLSYTISPGVSALIESGNNDFTNANSTTLSDQSNYTRLGLSVTF
jgi:hypothetical protein